MKTRCEDIFFLINLALDGEISPEERQQLDDHCDRCPHCAQLYLELQQMQIAMGSLEEIAPSDGFKDRVLTQIAAESTNHKVVSFPRQWKGIATVAACALLCFGVVQGDVLPGFGASMSTADSAAAPESVLYTTTAGGGDMGESNQMAPRDLADSEMMDSAAADIPEESVELDQTQTEADSAASFTLSEQVAQDLGVDTIRWIMIDTSHIPQSFPEGVAEVDNWTALPSGARYCVLEEELWQQTREIMGYDRSESIGNAQQTFVLVLVTK